MAAYEADLSSSAFARSTRSRPRMSTRQQWGRGGVRLSRVRQWPSVSGRRELACTSCRQLNQRAFSLSRRGKNSGPRGLPPSQIMSTGDASCVEECGYPLQVRAVEDPLWRNAAFTSHEYAPAGEVELVDRVCVRVDAEHAPQFEGSPVPSPVQIEPVRVCINFNSDPVLGARAEDRVDVDFVAWSAQQHAACQVAQIVVNGLETARIMRS